MNSFQSPILNLKYSTMQCTIKKDTLVIISKCWAWGCGWVQASSCRAEREVSSEWPRPASSLPHQTQLPTQSIFHAQCFLRNQDSLKETHWPTDDEMKESSIPQKFNNVKYKMQHYPCSSSTPIVFPSFSLLSLCLPCLLGARKSKLVLTIPVSVVTWPSSH